VERQLSRALWRYCTVIENNTDSCYLFYFPVLVSIFRLSYPAERERPALLVDGRRNRGVLVPPFLCSFFRVPSVVPITCNWSSRYILWCPGFWLSVAFLAPWIWFPALLIAVCRSRVCRSRSLGYHFQFLGCRHVPTGWRCSPDFPLQVSDKRAIRLSPTLKTEVITKSHNSRDTLSTLRGAALSSKGRLTKRPSTFWIRSPLSFRRRH
jgi:hypothetical protein